MIFDLFSIKIQLNDQKRSKLIENVKINGKSQYVYSDVLSFFDQI